MLRTCRTAAQLDELIRLQSALLAECAACIIGGVVRCTPDLRGCNWQVPIIRGADAGLCLLGMKDFIRQLQDSYSLGQPR
jgi:hypothetical protein